MSNNSTALVATVKVVDDATTPLGKIQDSMRKAGATDEEINKQIANSQLMVEIAQKGRLSTSQQLKFAMDAEAAKGSELGTELVTLEREYATLVKQMQAMAKYGVEVPQSMISQANAAKKAADSIREQTEKTKDLDEKSKSAAFGVGAANDSMSKMPALASRMAGGLGLVSQAAGGMGQGVGEATGKITYLATTIASGGPLGIGMAAATLAVGAATAAWKVYKSQADAVAGAVRSLAPVMKEITSHLQAQKDTTQSLADELRFYGMASRDVAIAKAQESLILKANLPALKAQLEVDEQRLAAKRKELAATKEVSAFLGAYAVIANAERDAKINEYNADVEMLNIRKKSIAASEADGEQIKKQISLLGSLKIADERAKDAIKNKTEALKEETDEIKAQRKEIEKWEDDELEYYNKRHKAMGKQLGYISESFGAQSDYYDGVADMEEKNAKAIEADQKKAVDSYKQTAETMGQAFGTGFAGMATGSKDAASTMVKSVVGSATTSIIAHAVTAAAGAMAAESSIPIIGPVLAVAAGAVMSGLVLGLLSKLPSFHTGGVVGADDGMRLPGMKSNERLVNALVGERFVAPGASAGGSGGGVSVTQVFNSSFQPTTASTKRATNDLIKAIRRQRRLGYAT